MVIELLKRVSLLLIALLIIGFCFNAPMVVGDEPDYTYISDTERWYYEKESYERPYWYWVPYRQYYNATHYNIVYQPYYTVGYSYRRVKVYEYYLKVDSDVAGASVTGEGWYREGSTATISADKTVDPGGDTKHHFSHWSGDYSGSSPSGSVAMDRGKNVVANYKSSHRIQVMSNPMDVLGFIEDDWYAEGETRILPSAPETVDAGQGKRYVFESWYVDGVKVAGNPVSVKLDEPHVVEARYGVQYYLDVRSLHGAPSGSGWYDKGATATFEVYTPVEAGTGRKWVFEQWSGDVLTASPQGSVVMDGAKTVNASWRLDSSVLYAIYGLIIAAIVVAIIVPTLLLARRGGSGLRGFKATRNCLNCGYSLSGEFQFCPICGSKKLSEPKKAGRGR